MVNQFSRIRALKVCLNCGNAKDQGLILCWPCHHNLKAYDGCYSKKTDQFLERREESLKARNAPMWSEG